MKVHYEIVKPDEGSCFRTLFNNVPTSELEWEYHYHKEIELICVLGGGGSRHVGYHKSNYKNGDLVLIGSNVPHSGFGQHSTDPHQEIVIQIKQSVLENSIQNIPEFKMILPMLERAKYGILFDHKTKSAITKKLKELLLYKGHQKYLLLLEIFCELAEKTNYTLLNSEIMPFSIIKKHKKRIELIFTLVENNFHKTIEIQEVAELSNLSVPAFCNFFKKTTKMTFTEFVNKFRINKACLYISQDKSISQSCYDAGFNNVPYFNRIFKEYTGKTPTEFKNSETLDLILK